METVYAIVAAFLMDAAFGDPKGMPHIIVGMGKAIAALEKLLRRLFPKTNGGELAAGAVIALVMPAASFGMGWGVINLCSLVHPLLGFAVQTFLCWQCIAMQSLRNAGMDIYKALCSGKIENSRLEVAKVVGRDTSELDETGVTKAAVETIAENTSDGVIAPLLYMAIAGAPLAMAYKAINTMDSMIGYKNERYLYFGKFAAKLDDVANFVPARLSGLLMVLSAYICGFDGGNAWRIFKRDRYKHKSPNSAQTESVVAGALHIRLAGNSIYFGKLVEKPFQGDDDRPVKPEDILSTNQMMYCASIMAATLFIIVRGFIFWF